MHAHLFALLYWEIDARPENSPHVRIVCFALSMPKHALPYIPHWNGQGREPLKAQPHVVRQAS